MNVINGEKSHMEMSSVPLFVLAPRSGIASKMALRPILAPLSPTSGRLEPSSSPDVAVGGCMLSVKATGRRGLRASTFHRYGSN